MNENIRLFHWRINNIRHKIVDCKLDISEINVELKELAEDFKKHFEIEEGEDE